MIYLIGDKTRPIDVPRLNGVLIYGQVCNGCVVVVMVVVMVVLVVVVLVVGGE